MKNVTTRIKYDLTAYDNPVATDGVFIGCEAYANRHVGTFMQN
jgi:hypothetical protein